MKKLHKKLFVAIAAVMCAMCMTVQFAACQPKSSHTHKWSDEWSTNQTHHWKNPTCNDTTKKKDEGTHIDSNNDGKCDVCNYTMHTHTATGYQYNDTHHWQVCTEDSTEFNRAEHNIVGNACTVCDYVEHIHSGAIYGIDKTYHWLICSADGEEIDKVEHTVVNGVCATCNYVETGTADLLFEEIKDEEENVIGYACTGINVETTATEIVVPSYHEDLPVLRVGVNAFYNANGMTKDKRITFTSAIIGYNVQEINKYAFFQCNGLENVTFPTSLKIIGMQAFDRNNLETLVIPEGVEEIYEMAFSNCENLAYITLPDTLTFIGNNAFGVITSLSGGISTSTAYAANEDNWENGLLYIGKYLIKADTELEGAVTVKDGTIGLASSVFSGCQNITSVIFPESIAMKEFTSTFYECYALTSVNLPASLTSIGYDMFYKCNALESFTIPEGIEYIGELAFGDCELLSSVTFPSTLKEIGAGAFKRCAALKSVNIPDNVEIIGDSAFLGTGLTSIHIPANVTYFGESAVEGCVDLEEITVDAGNTVYHVVGNSLVEKETKTLIAATKNTVIPADGSVMAIGNYAFAGHTELTEITIPAQVTVLGEGVFQNCENLTTITLHNGITEIGAYAFDGCSNLEEITLPNGITEIGDYTFRNCSKITTITLSEGITSIGKYAFYSCSALKTVYMPVTVTSIGIFGFRFCSSLETITFGGTTEQWGKVTKGSSWDNSTGSYTVTCLGDNA